MDVISGSVPMNCHFAKKEDIYPDPEALWQASTGRERAYRASRSVRRCTQSRR